MKARAKMLWKAMDEKTRKIALVYYCNLVHQVHHNCEHGGKDFDKEQKK
jgi:hypothetical protein